ncbi:c-type cytochrome [Azohydromonas caseinilytica]|uniref:C-type cytochrome n=1 Tax=Azohydromonas caseinilytica TaxID=2728836 RepID=A0A848FHQ9_9BURK|nr:c-type cytochrome [Azohydromonas caseinilytica]NML17740.1 c-type cytochrome [Azohydromonas caseinilytica]
MTKTLALSLALAGLFVTTAQAQPQGQAQGQAGDARVAMCNGCHSIPGYQASFPQVYKVPMISGQGQKYIEAALQAYRKGDRKHSTMHGVAASLTDQDISFVSAHYAQLAPSEAAPAPEAPRAPSAEVAALLTKGACVSCHGTNFSKPIDPSYPKIAGQYPDYLFASLKAYRTENNAAVGRNNAIMGGIVKQFSNAELKAIADYVGSLPGEVYTVPQSRFR